MKRKILAAMLATAGLVGAGSANAVYMIGGVDFGYAGSHIETTTLAETYINGNGQHLLGYGVVNTINGEANYASGGAQKLYFALDYTSQNFSPTSVEFTNGVVKLYLGNTFNLLSQSSAANLGIISSYSQWLQLDGHGFVSPTASANAQIIGAGTLTGASLSFTGTGLLDVNTSGAFGLASVAAALDTNLIGDIAGGFADIALTTSGNNLVLNRFDNTTGCKNGTAQAGQWCVSGSADLRGTTLPEPGTLALAGLGLLGAVVARRRKAKA